jgi:hypothetical protein
MFVNRIYLLQSYMFCSSIAPFARHLHRFQSHVVASRLCVAPVHFGQSARLVCPRTKPRSHTVRGGRSDRPHSQVYVFSIILIPPADLLIALQIPREHLPIPWFVVVPRANKTIVGQRLSSSPCSPIAHTVSIFVSWSRTNIKVWHNKIICAQRYRL